VERRTRPLHSAAVGEVWWFFASLRSPSGRYRLVALTPSADLFICAKDLFVEATAGTAPCGRPEQRPDRSSLLLDVASAAKRGEAPSRRVKTLLRFLDH
jgi:hypothetical protein